MRNFAAFIGLAIGGYLGWVLGTVADGYSAWALETHGGHTYAFVMTFVMALAAGYSFRHVVSALTARHAAAEEKVERLETNAPRAKARTGRTPPSPFPAFQS